MMMNENKKRPDEVVMGSFGGGEYAWFQPSFQSSTPSVVSKKYPPFDFKSYVMGLNSLNTSSSGTFN